MAPNPRTGIVSISPTEQQGGCRMSRPVQRHLTDGFAGEPFSSCVQVSGCCMVGTGFAVCGAPGCLVLPAWRLALPAARGEHRPRGRALPPASIWRAKKGLMNTLKGKPWCNTCLRRYTYSLNKRGAWRGLLWKSPAAALWHQQWHSEFSSQVRRMISAILNLGPEGGV